MSAAKRTSSQQELEQLSASVRTRFLAEKRVLNFDEYIAELLAHPYRHSRDAARYLRDCFDFYGSEEVERPYGKLRRFKLFDQSFVDQGEGGPRVRLSGHEQLQNAFYRTLANFARE